MKATTLKFILAIIFVHGFCLGNYGQGTIGGLPKTSCTGVETKIFTFDEIKEQKAFVASIDARFDELGSHGWQVNSDVSLIMVTFFRTADTSKVYEYKLIVCKDCDDSIKKYTSVGWDLKNQNLFGLVFGREKGQTKSSYAYMSDKSFNKFYKGKKELDLYKTETLKKMNDSGAVGWEMIFLRSNAIYRKNIAKPQKWEYTMVDMDSAEYVTRELNLKGNEGWMFAAKSSALHPNIFAEPVFLKRSAESNPKQFYYKTFLCNQILLTPTTANIDNAKMVKNAITSSMANGWQFMNTIDLSKKHFNGQKALLFSAEKSCVTDYVPSVAIYIKNDTADKKAFDHTKKLSSDLKSELTKLKGCVVYERLEADTIKVIQKTDSLNAVKKEPAEKPKEVSEDVSVYITVDMRKKTTTYVVKSMNGEMILSGKPAYLDIEKAILDLK